MGHSKASEYKLKGRDSNDWHALFYGFKLSFRTLI